MALGLSPELDDLLTSLIGDLSIEGYGEVRNPPGVDVDAAIEAAEAARKEGLGA